MGSITKNFGLSVGLVGIITIIGYHVLRDLINLIIFKNIEIYKLLVFDFSSIIFNIIFFKLFF
jgi:hypothetical protein